MAEVVLSSRSFAVVELLHLYDDYIIFFISFFFFFHFGGLCRRRQRVMAGCWRLVLRISSTTLHEKI